ncbi:MAG: sugar phosphate isomerase/epimerase [Haliscomenobacteraceae bacterium CHB4]|nr:sugar phosphate isomerase/epimerase [Haliscomenobacteraceae bacterium CHB4]
MNRRHFIKKTALAGGSLWLNPMQNKPDFQVPANFSLKIHATNWGFSGTWDAFAAKARDAGFDGTEVWVQGDEKSRAAFQEAMQQKGLAFGLLCGGSDPNPEKHLAQFETQLRNALAMKPLYVNCHSGRDYFTFEQAKLFFDLTAVLSRETGIPIYHETHRGRLCFAAHITRHFLESIPDLRLTLDISHWCNVHESLLGDQSETVALALSRTDHIHARVGHAEGPQVNDPRAPEWDNALKAHLAWWDKVVEIKSKAGQPLTMLAEFGPPHYLPALPYTLQPVADQWGINVHMMQLLRKRYSG